MTAEERISLWSELFSSTFTFFWSSTVTTHPEYWLTWSPLPGEQRRETPRSLLDPTLKVCWQKIIKMFDSRKNFSRVIKSKAASLVHVVCHENLRLSPSSFFLRYSTLLLCCKAFITFLWLSTEISCLLFPLPVAGTPASATLVQAFVYLSAIPVDCDEAWDLTHGQSVCTFKEIYICYQNI